MKREHLAAVMAALALAVTSCGGDDAKDDSTPAAAGTSTAEQNEQPQSDAQAGSQEGSSTKKAKNGSGGASAPADRKATGGDAEAQSKSRSGNAKSKPKSAAPKTPEEYLAALSPAERRHLHQDLYNQGKRACYVFGPEELARSFNLPASDPVELARQFAVAYEKATPSLILPYQQGCLAGLRKYERNPPKDKD